MTETQTIPRTLANRLLTLAQHAPEAEVCGLISINAQGQHRVYPVDNIAEDAGCVFEMEPQQQISAFKNMRDAQESIFAIYHSHPHSDAIPSIKDINEAAYTDALNIIISLNTKGVLDMRGYFYTDEKTISVDLVID